MRLIRALARRLVAWWAKADKATRTVGVQWYREARRIARQLARRYDCTVSRAAGVIAALSPRLTWTYNVTAAEAVLAGDRKVPGVFRASLAKARMIQEGARPLDVLRGPKVRAFYRALMGDRDAAVVDVWTARAAGVQDAPNEREYAQVAQALRMGADEVGVSTSELQAAVWVAIRGRA